MENYYQDLKNVEIRVLKVARNCKYFKENQSFTADKIKPEGLCLAAFHTIIPYIHTFHNNGEFTWMKDRKKVIAQCPNPKVCIALEINKLGNSKFGIHIVQIKGICPEEHKLHDSFQIDLNKLNFCYNAFDTLFPSINEFALNKKEKCKKLISCCASCNSNCENTLFEIKRKDVKKTSKVAPVCDVLKKQAIKAVKMDRICRRYHLSKKKRYSPREPAPKNFCLEAYHTCYPYCLALSYNAYKDNYIYLRCPNPDNYIKLKIIRKPSKIKFILKILHKALKYIRPTDIINSKIYIKVIDQKGKCPKNIKKGDIFVFNKSGDNELCPAAFYTLYPSMRLLGKEIKHPWSKSDLYCIGQCPDHLTKVRYQIKRVD